MVGRLSWDIGRLWPIEGSGFDGRLGGAFASVCAGEFTCGGVPLLLTEIGTAGKGLTAAEGTGVGTAVGVEGAVGDSATVGTSESDFL